MRQLNFPTFPTSTYTTSFLVDGRSAHRIIYRLRYLSIILLDLDVQLSGQQLNPAQKTRLAEVATNYNGVLHDLRKKIEKYHSLEYSGRDIDKQAKKVWRRFRWDPDDVKELRERIISNITMLNAFQSQVSK